MPSLSLDYNYSRKELSGYAIDDGGLNLEASQEQTEFRISVSFRNFIGVALAIIRSEVQAPKPIT